MFHINKKRHFLIIGLAVLVVGAGLVNNFINTKQDLDVSANYVNYEEEQLRLHDGEVLVDSIELVELPGSSETATIGEDELVASDNFEELANSDAYFEEVRATINMDRNEIIAMLTDVIAETKEGPERDQATKQKLKIIDYMNKEKTIETLARNKGIPDALVIMTDQSVNVTLNQKEISKTDIAKITDIVIRETGRSADQIVIQSKF